MQDTETFDMRYWWVNQNQTYQAEMKGGYMWSPKRNKNGVRNQFYENMREVAPGDLVFSFRDRMIGTVGVVSSFCYEAPKPSEFGTAGQNWEQIGWRADVSWTEYPSPMMPKKHIDRIRPLLPTKYSPLQQSGDGLQSVYLAAISQAFADTLVELLVAAGNPVTIPTEASIASQADRVTGEVEDYIEEEIEHSALAPTEKEQLVTARRGQGKFRENVQNYERACRITGVSDARFLIASHIKPWRSSNNSERLDGQNGLMLSPNTDFLFDRGFISFSDDGTLLVSPVVDTAILTRLGIPTSGTLSVGHFTPKQREYLRYHRREVFLEAGRDA